MTIHLASTQGASPQDRTDALASRRGSISVLSAVIALVLVAVVGLGLDTALVMTARQQLQRSADAAALAAAAKVKVSGESQSSYARTRAAALETAAAKRGIGRLYTEASEPARRFFERRGFILLHRRDFALAGVAIHNFAMEKPIAPARDGE